MTPVVRGAVDWPACRNVRDLGGLPAAGGARVMPRALVRSDSLHRLDAEGVARVRAYGVSRVVDLRQEEELTRLPSPFAGTSVYAHRTFNPPTDADEPLLTDLAAVYLAFLDRCPDLAAGAVAAICDAPPGAVVVHCHAGKDRTGIIVALVLDVVGVPREEIVADYVASDTALVEHYAEELAQIQDDERREWLRGIQHSRPETILGMLEHLDSRYGGAAAYLCAGGLQHESVDRLRRRLTGPVPAVSAADLTRPSGDAGPVRG